MRHLFPAALLALLCTSLFAAPAARPYHLELEITPKAVFPYLGRFGDVGVHVYPGGIRGEALWLHGFSRNASRTVTVANPLGRMYVDVPTGEIASILERLAGSTARPERSVRPTMGPKLKGTVKGVAATRYRLMYGKQAWIDVWMTDVIPTNPQYRAIVDDVLEGIAPGTASVARGLPGTPIYVELNFRRFRKLALVRLKKLSFGPSDEQAALTLGRLYVRAPLLGKLLGGQ